MYVCAGPLLYGNARSTRSAHVCIGGGFCEKSELHLFINLVLQAMALNMSTITNHNTSSMLALHLAFMDLSSWGQELKQNNFTFIKAPLVVGSKPTGYSASWSHKPLSCTQTFFLFKQRAALRPTHNAWKMFNANKKSPWRELWSDLVMLKPSEYNKESKSSKLCLLAY